LFLPEQIPPLLLDFKRVSKVHLLLYLLLLLLSFISQWINVAIHFWFLLWAGSFCSVIYLFA